MSRTARGRRIVEAVAEEGFMRSVTYSMGVSLDGYIVGPDGTFAWTAPDKHDFRFSNEDIRAVGVHQKARRQY
jgi:hypothetical protein